MGGPQLCFGVVFGMGQYLVGLVVTMLILAPLFGTPAIFATILEVGFSGGHGTAAGMAETFDKMGFPAGGALGQMSATVGILVAVVFGIILVNIAIRSLRLPQRGERHPDLQADGLILNPRSASRSPPPPGHRGHRALTFHFGIMESPLSRLRMLAVVKELYRSPQPSPLPRPYPGDLVKGASMAFKWTTTTTATPSTGSWAARWTCW